MRCSILRFNFCSESFPILMPEASLHSNPWDFVFITLRDRTELEFAVYDISRSLDPTLCSVKVVLI
jgi:hypothetical protein